MSTSSGHQRRPRCVSTWLLTALATCSMLVSTLAGLAPVRAFGSSKPNTATTLHPAGPGATTKARAMEALGRMPLGFEPNAGQADARVKFLARGSGYTLFLTPAEAVLALSEVVPDAEGAGLVPRGSGLGVKAAGVLSMKLVAATRAPEVAGEEELPGRVNYFKGSDPGRGQTGVVRYARVRYKSVYPGVDVVYYGRDRRLEYDFMVAPGADPRKIQIAYGGAEHIEIDAAGDLVLHTRGGAVRQHKPFIYQEAGGERQAVEGRYVKLGEYRIGFEVGPYDHTRRLVIDPVISYSTYLGGTGFEMPSGIGVDAAGNIYVTGTVASDDFPVTPNAFQKSKAGAFSPGLGFDVFVSKLRPAGQGKADLVYSTYIGGSRHDQLPLMKVDAAGNVYVAGLTGSDDFPTTPGAASRSARGGFTLKLNAEGGLAYSTRLSGGPLDLAVGADGTIYVTGATFATDFPITPNAMIPTPTQKLESNGASGGFFMQRIRPAGGGQSDLLYSSYAHARRMAVDAAGNVYLTDPVSGVGDPWPTTPNAVQPMRPKNDICYPTDQYGEHPCSDVYIEKLRPTGEGGYEVAYATYLGGKGLDGVDRIAVDRQGFIYLLGTTSSTPSPWLPGALKVDDFPVTENALQSKNNGNADLFISKIDPNSKAGGAAGLVYSTLFGGRGKETPYDIALGADGSAYVAGETDSDNFVITANVLQAKYGGSLGNTISKPGGDGFIVKLNPAGSALAYSTYLGTSSGDGIRALAVDAAGDAYVTGYTWSSEFPTTAGSFQPRISSDGVNSPIDAFVTRVSENRKADAPAFAAGTGAFNPIDDPMSFVRQQYRDFLGREADDDGLRFWTNEITSCGSDAQCIEVKRTNVSAAFFLSIESQQSGYFFYRMYKAAFGEMPRMAEYRAAAQAIGKGVVVNTAGWETRLNANRRTFAEAWVTREKFASVYSGLGNAAYVDTLFANAGVSPAQGEREALISGLDSGSETRATALMKVADNADFYRRELNRAFVLTEYFGYLQRDPDTGRDTDLTGLNYWLQKLESHGGNYVAAEMVRSFLVSAEYRERFGPE